MHLENNENNDSNDRIKRKIREKYTNQIRKGYNNSII